MESKTFCYMHDEDWQFTNVDELFSIDHDLWPEIKIHIVPLANHLQILKISSHKIPVLRNVWKINEILMPAIFVDRHYQ